MPIYAYKCSSCNHAQDVLQKMSDPILTVCPECGQDTYVKQVTAAGFQLKGSGWYVTDFRDNKGGATGATAPSTTATESAPTTAPAASSAASNSTS
ncbi:zinc ribbon domain-containing protein [Alcaligenaceae bacterium]|nr:zinc ribbon domain-containing protein [Alcaligenaceae bacterium]